MGEFDLIKYLQHNPLLEYGNKGPTSPISYLIKGGELFEIPFSKISKISNLEYDMGGGEISYHPEPNVVVIDNIPVGEFSENLQDDNKIYVEYNLEKPFSFPKANKIYLSQVVYHIKNIKGLAKTINNSLKSGGELYFFSDIMNEDDKEFLEDLTQNYKFFPPKDFSLDSLSKYKSKSLVLSKDKPQEQQKKKKWQHVFKYKIKTKHGNAIVKYSPDINYSGDWDGDVKIEQISGNIPEKYFLYPNPRLEWLPPDKKEGEPQFLPLTFYDGTYPNYYNYGPEEYWDHSKSPFPYYYDHSNNKRKPLEIISWERIED